MILAIIAFGLCCAALGWRGALIATRPELDRYHWQLWKFSYTRSGKISSLTLWKIRRIRAGCIVEWVRAA